MFSCAVVSDSFVTPWTVSTRFLCLWDFPGKNTTGVHCHFLLQGIFLTQVSNLSLLHYGQTFYRWAIRYLESTNFTPLQQAFLLLITHFFPSCLSKKFLSFLFLEIRSYDGWLEFILLDRERGKKGLHQFFVLFCFYSTSLPSSRAKAPCQDKPKIFACLSPRSIVWRVKSSK